MATAVKQRPAKPVVDVTLTLTKETERFVVYKAEDTPVNTIYVAKDSFPEDYPTEVRVTVTPVA